MDVSAEEIAEAEVVDLTEEEEGEAPKEDDGEYVSKAEFTDLQEALLQIVEHQKKLEGAITELSKSDEEKIAEKAADTPEFSLAAIVAQQLRASQADETALGVGDMKLAKDKPKETKADAEKSITGIPWIDQMLEQEQ